MLIIRQIIITRMSSSHHQSHLNHIIIKPRHLLINTEIIWPQVLCLRAHIVWTNSNILEPRYVQSDTTNNSDIPMCRDTSRRTFRRFPRITWEMENNIQLSCCSLQVQLQSHCKWYWPTISLEYYTAKAKNVSSFHLYSMTVFAAIYIIYFNSYFAFCICYF